MDNVCHTLVGLALAESGLGRRTARGALTLAVAANLPDVDALLYVAGGGLAALEGRRGWTHGVLAMAALPLLLATVVWWWDRVAHLRALRRNALAAANGGPPADLGALFVLATVGVLSHTLLDWTNGYGVRLLMPFGGHWYYGDALFIVDPWLWAVLGLGVALARRRRRTAARRGSRARRADPTYETRPARVALAASALYVAAAVASAVAGRVVVERAARAAGLPPARRVMAGPVPVTPFRRDVVRDLGGDYETGTLHWLPRPHYAETRRVPSGAGTPAAAAAARTPAGRAFLAWSRFPIFGVDPGRPGRVRIRDARYAGRTAGGWAEVEVEVR